MHARMLAIGFALASMLLAATFGVLTAVCGAMQQSESSNSSGTMTTTGPHCVSAFHPLTPVWALSAVAGAAGLWASKVWPAIVLGAIGTALGVLAGFSAGFFGIGCGLLLLVAGLVGRTQSAQPA